MLPCPDWAIARWQLSASTFTMVSVSDSISRNLGTAVMSGKEGWRRPRPKVDENR